ncbi:MAG: 4-(cytidine 5'-diphospho)-2-C-methyl-D-erythritol kinase [Desulfovibrio sp.]
MPLLTRLTAPAKINLNLYITGVRADGFHELDTLFLKLPAPADTLTLSPPEPGAGLELCCDIPGLTPEKNIIRKAWDAFAQATGFCPDLRIEVDKRIPQGMGLGGGSSDAGTLLRHLNTLAGPRALTPEALNALGAGLGADVPLFLIDAPAARATGIGERLAPVELDLAGLTLLLACPPVHVNTAWAYAEWDRRNPCPPALTTRNLGNKSSGPESAPVLHNDFEDVVFRAFPQLRKIKESLLAAGAAGAAMSGSGAGIFALFRGRAAKDAASLLEADGIPFYIHMY